MAENAPPPSTSAADSTRGVPYYEKLKRDVRDTLNRKRLMDKNMAALEDQIYRAETSYLEETGAGSIIKGFDNYIKGSTSTGNTSANAGGGTSTRRKGQIMDADRVFSRSSASFMRELSPTSSAQTTPSHTLTPTSGNPNSHSNSTKDNHPTPTSATSTKGTTNNKKTKKGEKEEDENEGKTPKRLKMTFRGGE